MNPEKMSKDQNKKEFARFVEDYNTGRFYPSFCIPSLIVIPTSQLLCLMKNFTIWRPMKGA
jgi:hypothetical protein